MTISFSITYGKLEGLKKAARELRIDLRSAREPLKRAIQQVLIPSFRENFDMEGRPPWTPAAHDYGHPLLNDTGQLRNRSTILAIWRLDREKAEIDPSALISRVGPKIVHQGGAARGTGSSKDKDRGRALKRKGLHVLPARPFIMMQDEDADKIQRVYDDWLSERIKRRWS